ncbi:MAG: nucleotide sugar dehydrogenase [Candidatus Diapherotrites archaeon]
MKKTKVTIIGLGYVGLPLACLCAEKGLEVRGLEVDKGKAEKINKGLSPLKDSDLEKKVKKLKGRIFATTSPGEALEGADVAIIAVPTPSKDHRPDLKFVESACKTLSGFLEKGMLVIIESTIFPGTTEEFVKPLLEKNGLKAGEDFFLAHCPERIDPGNRKWTLEKIPRVLGGITGKDAARATGFYRKILESEIKMLDSPREAEAVKVYENSFRDINIAFVNELAKSFDKMGINITSVIEGAKTKPFGFMPFYPGPGVGGHCIPKDPYYLIESARRAGFEHEFLLLARKINDSMPAYCVSLLEKALEKKGSGLKGSKIALLGLAYKPEIDDLRESPSLSILALLKKRGAKVNAFDPFIKISGCANSIEDAVVGCDAVIVGTNHKGIVKTLSPAFAKKHGLKILIDTRNCLKRKAFEKAGILYKGVGR